MQDILLDHDENLWVATSLRTQQDSRRKDDNDIQTFLSQASFVLLSGLRYPIDVISPLANADCRSLAIHPTRTFSTSGTLGGLSGLRFFRSTAAHPPNLSQGVLCIQNPVYAPKGHTGIKVAEHHRDRVTVEVYDLEGRAGGCAAQR